MDAASERAERDRIKAEQDQAEAAYVTRERECREKFVVTSCIEQARRDRRQTLQRLRQQQEVLDELQRKQRAAQRVDDIRAKVSGDEAKQRESAGKERRRSRAEAASQATAASAPAAASAASAPTAVVVSEPPSAIAKQPSARSSEADIHAKKESAYEKRVEEAREHRAEVERRNAERAASGKTPAKGLPTPASASR